MTHVFALAHLYGDDRADRLLDHGVSALRTTLRDDRHGAGSPSPVRDDGDKEAYAHAFVVLAATSDAGAGHPDGPALLDAALSVMLERFWDEGEGLVVDRCDSTWTRLESYRGINANTHTVEAFPAAPRRRARARVARARPSAW